MLQAAPLSVHHRAVAYRKRYPKARASRMGSRINVKSMSGAWIQYFVAQGQSVVVWDKRNEITAPRTRSQRSISAVCVSM